MQKECRHTDWIEVVKTTDLLQSGEIRPASKIVNPETLTKEELFPLTHMASIYCVSHRFNAVTYTQFPDQLYSCVKARENLKNIIYFGSDDGNSPLTNLIVINPSFSFLEKSKYYISIEGCGSIEMGRIQMAIKRPRTIKLSGYFWQIGMESPQKRTVILSDWPSSMVQHENDHLKGKDATFFPERILDMINPNKSFLENIGSDEESLRILLKTLSETEGCDYLVNKKGKLMVVNYKGEIVKKYPRVISLE